MHAECQLGGMHPFATQQRAVQATHYYGQLRQGILVNREMRSRHLLDDTARISRFLLPLIEKFALIGAYCTFMLNFSRRE